MAFVQLETVHIEQDNHITCKQRNERVFLANTSLFHRLWIVRLNSLGPLLLNTTIQT